MSATFFEHGGRYLSLRDADVYLRCQENGRFTSIPAHVSVVGRYSPYIQGRYDRHRDLIFRLYPSGFYPCGLAVSIASFVDLDNWTADVVRKCLSIFYMGNYTDAAYRRIGPSSIMYITHEQTSEMLRDGSTATAIDTSQDSALWGYDEAEQEGIDAMTESERRNDAFDRLFSSLCGAHAVYGLCAELLSVKGMLVARERLSSALCLLLHLLAQERPRSNRRTLYEYDRIEAFLRRAERRRTRCPGLLERTCRIIVEYWDEVPFRSRIEIPGWHEYAVLCLLDERRRIRLEQADPDRPRTWKVNRESRGGLLSDDDWAGPSTDAPTSSGPSLYMDMYNGVPGGHRPLPEPPSNNEQDNGYADEMRGRTFRRHMRHDDLFDTRRASPGPRCRCRSIDDTATSSASSRASLYGNDMYDDFLVPSGDEADDEKGEILSHAKHHEGIYTEDSGEDMTSEDENSADENSADETYTDGYQEPTPEDSGGTEDDDDEDDDVESEQSESSSEEPTWWRLLRAVISAWNYYSDSDVPSLMPDDPDGSTSFSEAVESDEEEDEYDLYVGGVADSDEGGS
ncbi:hypothetical protein LQW54_008670 [Pestalotiopsis sp. IQ-011]